eukprot:TRINITY_DN59441_c0_g1_i1.p1 TRINITY_DN59441_c0_g1~~TRINITY_DN59441_c0_g1_i1.p1  ORF type:complete len:461 (-),score=73.24 TRINITY_DN59441_c0_g1_i1:187-1569(-)
MAAIAEDSVSNLGDETRQKVSFGLSAKSRAAPKAGIFEELTASVCAPQPETREKISFSIRSAKPQAQPANNSKQQNDTETHREGGGQAGALKQQSENGTLIEEGSAISAANHQQGSETSGHISQPLCSTTQQQEGEATTSPSGLLEKLVDTCQLLPTDAAVHHLLQKLAPDVNNDELAIEFDKIIAAQQQELERLQRAKTLLAQSSDVDDMLSTMLGNMSLDGRTSLPSRAPKQSEHQNTLGYRPSTQPAPQSSWTNHETNDPTGNTSGFAILDTNQLLEHLDAVDAILRLALVTVVIPRRVHIELDGLQKHEPEQRALQARQALRFLESCSSPMLRWQREGESRSMGHHGSKGKGKFGHADDEILECALFFQSRCLAMEQASRRAVLVTDDKGLKLKCKPVGMEYQSAQHLVTVLRGEAQPRDMARVVDANFIRQSLAEVNGKGQGKHGKDGKAWLQYR